MERPAREAHDTSATASVMSDTTTAGIKSNPVRKPPAMMPFRVRVSFQPWQMRKSAIYPPSGSARAKIRNATAEYTPTLITGRCRTVIQ